MASATQPRYRARVAPRSGPSRGTRIHWDRVGRVALVLVLFAVIASYLSPTLNVFDTWRESRATEVRLAELKAENESLTNQAKALKKPAAAIAEARKLGMLAPGERGYVIKGLD